MGTNENHIERTLHSNVYINIIIYLSILRQLFILTNTLTLVFLYL